MFAVVVSILFISLLFQLHNVRKHAKHDRYLYAFCALRREVMQYLRENHDIISKTEHKSIKQSLEVLNNTIKLYSEYKTIIFNFRLFAKYIDSTKSLTDSSEKIVKTENSTINGFHDKLRRNIIKTFFAYTPFLGSEVCLRLLPLLISGLTKIGLSKLDDFKEKLLVVSTDFKEHSLA